MQSLRAAVGGFRDGLEETSNAIVKICGRNRSYDIRLAKDEEERARFWLGRKGAFGAMGRISPDMLVMDAVIPRTRCCFRIGYEGTAKPTLPALWPLAPLVICIDLMFVLI